MIGDLLSGRVSVSNDSGGGGGGIAGFNNGSTGWGSHWIDDRKGVPFYEIRKGKIRVTSGLKKDEKDANKSVIGSFCLMRVLFAGVLIVANLNCNSL